MTHGATHTYNEHDAWGNAYTSQPEGINQSGLNLLTGFTGYTWDAVLEVHFAQARLYDPIAKRFMQTDPIGGRVRSPMSINPYLYCRNDPVNYIDPTGMWIDSDSTLSPEQQAAIIVLTQIWYAAADKLPEPDRDTMREANEAAEAIRNRYVGAITPGIQYDAFYEEYPYTPTPYDIIFTAVAVTQENKTMYEVRTTVYEWMAMINGGKNPTIAIGNYGTFFDQLGSSTIAAFGATAELSLPYNTNDRYETNNNAIDMTWAETAGDFLLAMIAVYSFYFVIDNVIDQATQVPPTAGDSVISDAPVVGGTTESNTGTTSNTSSSTTAPTASVEEELTNIAKKHKNFKCVEAANEMKAYLQSNRQHGALIIIRYPQYPGNVLSFTYNRFISNNGMHQGVLYNGIVFCNVHPYGLPKPAWIADFDGIGPKTITEIPF
ncbi:MAG: hypothetical protein FWG88_11795 [Oscillospiraceae bacterium]|nr:hypothetical protein [Oscillospiraceae bacterium]